MFIEKNNKAQFKNNSFRPNKCNKMMPETDSTAQRRMEYSRRASPVDKNAPKRKK